MRISRVRIQNFRSIRDASFDIPTLCALTGGNNSGKSNIIAAIDLVLGERWPSHRSVDERDFYGHETTNDLAISIWFDQARQVAGDVGNPSDYTGIQFRVTHYRRRTAKNQPGDPRSVFVCIDDDGEAVEVLQRPRPGTRPFNRPANVTSDIREELPAVFIDVDRSARFHLSGGQWSILGRLLREVSKDFKTDTERVLRFREAFDEARTLLRTPQFEDLKARVVRHLEAHTGLSDIDVILDDVDPINIYKTFSILFKDPHTPMPVDADRMGTGIQSAVVIALLQAYRELRKENAVLLFEEPELFLHPHGRRHLFKLLCRLADEGTQVIYATHSQDFIDLMRLDSLRLVSKGPDRGTEIRPPAEDVLPADWREKLRLAKRFAAPRSELLFADSVVFVEGPTEQATIRALAEMMPEPLDLDRLNCSVIDCGGKDSIPILASIARSINKRTLLVFDTDSDKTKPDDVETNNSKNEAVRASADGWASLFPFDPYFEAAAGIPGEGRKEKEQRAREFVAAVANWRDVPTPLKEMMNSIVAIARIRDA